VAETEHWLHAGVVGRPHGLDGSFHVAEPVAALLEKGTEVRLGDGRRTIVRLAGHDERPIVRLEGCEDRDAAVALRGQEMLVARSNAPDLEEDEWWATDLEGCAVRDGAREVGVVARLLALPSCEVLEVARAGDAPNLLVPLVQDAVRDVDLDGRVIDVDLEFLGEA
jgi:16S rRNA processing protein RimM